MASRSSSFSSSQYEMSKPVRSRSKSRGRRDEEESVELIEPVVAEQSGDEPPQQEEQSTESQGVTPGEEPKEEGEPEVKGADLEADVQQLSQPKTGGKPHDVKEEFVPCLEPPEVPEVGEGQPDV